MMNGGARLGDLPMDVIYDIGYSEIYRLVELMASVPVMDPKAREHPLIGMYESVDAEIRDATPDADTGLPNWVLRNMPVAADGTRMAPEDLPPMGDPNAMPPPGAVPGKPMPQ